MKKFIVLTLMMIVIGSVWVCAEEPKVKIARPLNAQVELVSPQGTRVLIDVAYEEALSSPATEKDLLLITHYHTDHICNIINTFTGQRLEKAGELVFGDVKVKGIPSVHLQGEKLTQERGTNYIYLIEIGGLRIAHFGDIGQDQLQPWQLKELGKIDIAFMQFANSFSLMDVFNLKGFNLMDQLKPQLIIPCHIDLDAGKYAAKYYDSYYTNEKTLEIGPSNLTGRTKLIFMGDSSATHAKISHLPLWKK